MKGFFGVWGSSLAGALILMIPAFINGYPFAYSDTSTYLASGFQLNMPADRPMTYGLFLRAFSLNGFSLWTVILVQNLLISYLLYRCLQRLIPEGSMKAWLFLIVVLFLSLFSGLGVLTDQLMPDLFTPVLFLSAFLLLTGGTGRQERIFLYAVFFIACAMHLSHLVISIAFIAGVIVFRQADLFGMKESVRIRPVLILTILASASVLTMGAPLAKSRHVFFMGAMVEHGILKQYLDDRCGSEDDALCAYKDSLPGKAWEFIWDPASPFYKVGGWKHTKVEFSRIIRNTLTTPKYMLLHIRASAGATLRQLILFRSGEGMGAFGKGTRLYERIGQYIPRELTGYGHSAQNRSNLTAFRWCNIMQYIVVIAALAVICGLMLPGGKAGGFRTFRTMAVLFILGILANAWACGTFANALDRLGARTMWLLPFLAFTGILMRINRPAG